MVLFNGDRVCIKISRSRSKSLEFGRVQEYVDVEETSFTESEEFSNYGDVLSADETILSVCKTIPASNIEARKSLKRVPVLHLMAPWIPHATRRAATLALGNVPVPGMPGITSPIIMKKSKSQTDMQKPCSSGITNLVSPNVKKQIIWDNNSRPETEILGDADEKMFTVVDRKFVVGQPVIRNGKLGKVVEVVPLATIHVPFCDPENKHEAAHIIADVPIPEILPISPIFCGVTIEFEGWLGLVTDVERRVVYKLEDSTYLTRTFFDSGIVRNSRDAPTDPKDKDNHLKIQNRFCYPFISGSEMPFTGKVETFTKQRLDQLKIEEDENKENNSRYATRSRTGIGSSQTLVALSPAPELRKKQRAEDFITAIVESVSIQSIKVRWTGRLPAYLIKVKEEIAEKQEKATKRLATPHHDHRFPEMPSTFIRYSANVNKVRPLYIHPALYFEKKGLCVYKTDKKNEEIMIPERKWSFDLYTKPVAGDDNNAEVVASFNLSSVTFSKEELEKRKDSGMKCGNTATTTTDDSWIGKRKRCHDEDTRQQHGEESVAGGSRSIIVCKHFVRHMYKVVWDEKKNLQQNGNNNKRAEKNSCRDSSSRGMYWGTQLQPVNHQEHKLCLGLIHSHLYVLPRSGSCMHGKCDYGVVVEKPRDNSVVVEWLKIQATGNVTTVRVLKCQLYEVEKHPSFNELHEGRVVVRGKDAERFKGAREFCFGTVVRVNRFALGQVSVFCPIQEKIVELWPHMVEVFAGMSMQELIHYKVVGANKILSENRSQNESQQNKNKQLRVNTPGKTHVN